MVKLRLSELFYSIQGEGVYAGIPMVFVRFRYCPWRCSFCDSVYTWAKSDAEMGGLPEPDPRKMMEALQGGWFEAKVEEVVAQVRRYPVRWVCLTGGEPLAQPVAFRELVGALKTEGYFVEVETSGLNVLPHDATFDLVNSWVWDVKCPSSGMEMHNKFAELRRLRQCDQVKFVVADLADCEYAKTVCREYSLGVSSGPTVLVSPVFVTEHYTQAANLKEVAKWLKIELPVARLSLQIHRFIWGNVRGV